MLNFQDIHNPFKVIGNTTSPFIDNKKKKVEQANASVESNPNTIPVTSSLEVPPAISPTQSNLDLMIRPMPSVRPQAPVVQPQPSRSPLMTDFVNANMPTNFNPLGSMSVMTGAPVQTPIASGVLPMEQTQAPDFVQRGVEAKQANQDSRDVILNNFITTSFENPDLSLKEIRPYFPELDKYNNDTLKNFITTAFENPDLSLEEIKPYFPEFIENKRDLGVRERSQAKGGDFLDALAGWTDFSGISEGALKLADKTTRGFANNIRSKLGLEELTDAQFDAITQRALEKNTTERGLIADIFGIKEETKLSMVGKEVRNIVGSIGGGELLGIGKVASAASKLAGGGTVGSAVAGATLGLLDMPIYTALSEGRLPTREEELAGGVFGAALPILGKGASKLYKESVPFAKKVVEKVKNKISPTIEVKIAKNVEKAKDVASQVVGGIKKEEDKIKLIKGLSEVDTAGIETAKDLTDLLDSQRKNVMRIQDDVLSQNTNTKFTPENSIVETKVGNTTVKQEPLSKALDQLEELYISTDNPVKAASLNEIKVKYNNGGLSAKETNDVARIYSSEYGSQAFNKMGDPLTSVTKIGYENNRKALKNLIRQQDPSGIAKELDLQYSKLSDAHRIVNKFAEAVSGTKGKYMERSTLQKVARIIGEPISWVTENFGIKDLIQKAFVKSNIGSQTPNNLGIEANLSKNLKKLKQITREIENLEKKRISKTATETKSPTGRRTETATVKSTKANTPEAKTTTNNVIGKKEALPFKKPESKIAKKTIGENKTKKTPFKDDPVAGTYINDRMQEVYREIDNGDFKKAEKLFDKLEKDYDKGLISKAEFDKVKKARETLYDSDAYKKDFYKKIEKNIEKDDNYYKQYKSFQQRALTVEGQEQRIGKVGKNNVGAEYKSTQRSQRSKDKERLIKDIGDEFGIDQFEAANMYDDMLRNPFNKKYQVKGAAKIETISEAEVTAKVRKYFTEEELPVIFREKIITPEGQEAFGAYFDGMVEFAANPSKYTPEHEVVHGYLDLFSTVKEKLAVLNYAKNRFKSQIDEIAKKQKIGFDEAAEELIADGFVDFVRGKETFTGKISSYFKDVWNKVRKVFGKENKMRDLYNDIYNKKRSGNVNKVVDKPKQFSQKERDAMGKNGNEVTANVLNTIEKELKGETVSKGWLTNYMNRQGVKSSEKRIINSILDAMPEGSIAKGEFNAKVKTQLLDLKQNISSTYDDYNYLRDEVGYDVDDNITRIYEVPFSTKGGTSHFSHETKNYFAHARIEEIGDIHRVVEVQSDLFQQGTWKEYSFREKTKQSLQKNNADLALYESDIQYYKDRIADATFDDKQYIEGRKNNIAVMENKIKKTLSENDALLNSKDIASKENAEYTLKKADLNFLDEAKSNLQDIEKFKKDFQEYITEKNKASINGNSNKEEDLMFDFKQKYGFNPRMYKEIEKSKEMSLVSREEFFNQFPNKKRNLQYHVADLKQQYENTKAVLPFKDDRLEDYSNTWYERIVREEIKNAAKSNKKFMELPDGKTIARIEKFVGDGIPEEYHIGDIYESGNGELLIVADDFNGFNVINTDIHEIDNQFNFSEILDDQVNNMIDDAKRYFDSIISRADTEERNAVINYFKKSDLEDKNKILKLMKEGEFQELVDNYPDEASDALSWNTEIVESYVERDMFKDANEYVEYARDNYGSNNLVAAAEDRIYKFGDDVDVLDITETRSKGGVDGSNENWKENLSDKSRTVVDFYEKRLLKYAEKYAKQNGKTPEYIESDGGRWLRIPISEADAQAPVMAFQRKGIESNPFGSEKRFQRNPFSDTKQQSQAKLVNTFNTYEGLSDTIIKDGGITLNVNANKNLGGQPFISISPYPNRTKIVKKGELNDSKIVEYLRDNKDLINSDGHTLGGRVDGEDVYLDVAIALPKELRDDAIRLGKKYNQKAIFDLETFQEIATMGDGSPIDIDEMSVMKEIQDLLSKLKNNGKSNSIF